jgi:hypothetical protein
MSHLSVVVNNIDFENFSERHREAPSFFRKIEVNYFLMFKISKIAANKRT